MCFGACFVSDDLWRGSIERDLVTFQQTFLDVARVAVVGQ